jgi:PAS domain-containing protein
VRRHFYVLIGAGLVLLLCVSLIAAIYFTTLELPWIAFLTGILFAGVTAIVSQASRAQWQNLRRTRQLQRAKVLLGQESLHLKHANQALKQANYKFQFINDAMPVMTVFIDRDERCHYHNHAFTQWCRHKWSRDQGPLVA